MENDPAGVEMGVVLGLLMNLIAANSPSDLDGLHTG